MYQNVYLQSRWQASKHLEDRLIISRKFYLSSNLSYCILTYIRSSMYVKLYHCALRIRYFVVWLISFSDPLGVLVVPGCQSELVVLLDSTQFRAPWWKRVQWWNYYVSIAGWLKPAPPIDDAGRRGVGLNQTVNIETSDFYLYDKSPFLLWRILDKQTPEQWGHLNLLNDKLIHYIRASIILFLTLL